MNRYSAEQPIEPFYVPAKVLKCTATSEGTGGGATNGGGKGRNSVDWTGLDTVTGKAVVGVVFLGAYLLIERNPVFAPITVLLLLVVVLLALDTRRRRIAIAPLTLAAIRLASEMSANFARNSNRSLMRQTFGTPEAWLPLFLAACIFFGPRLHGVTETIALTLSMVLLVSGLLPGEGYLVVFAIVEYTLFVAIAVGLTVDMASRAPMQRAVPVQR